MNNSQYAGQTSPLFPRLNQIHDLYQFVNFNHQPVFEDFDIFTMEQTYPEVKTEFPVHKRGFYMVFLLKDLQQGEVIINDHCFKKLENVLLFLGPEHLFGGIRGQSMQGYVITFRQSFISRFTGNPTLEFPFFDASLPNFFQLSHQEQSMLNGIFNCLQQDKHNRQTASHLLMALLHKSLQIQQGDQQQKPPASTEYELVCQFNKLIGEHITRQHSVEFYASRLNLTANYLNQRIKALTGVTAKALIHQRLLMEAKSMLLHSNMNVSTIAYQLGFSDSSYFGRFFKKHTGVSPGNYQPDHTS